MVALNRWKLDYLADIQRLILSVLISNQCRITERGLLAPINTISKMREAIVNKFSTYEEKSSSSPTSLALNFVIHRVVVNVTHDIPYNILNGKLISNDCTIDFADLLENSNVQDKAYS